MRSPRAAAVFAVVLGIAFLAGSVLLTLSVHHSYAGVPRTCISSGPVLPRGCGSRQRSPLTARLAIIGGGVVGCAMLWIWARQRLSALGRVPASQ